MKSVLRKEERLRREGFLRLKPGVKKVKELRKITAANQWGKRK